MTTKSPLTSEFIAYVRSFNTEAADAIEAQAKEIIGLDSQLRDSHEMTCHQDARIAELEAENAKLRRKLNSFDVPKYGEPGGPI